MIEDQEIELDGKRYVWSYGRLAFTEPEAAALLGVKPHVLRDCRRRGELQGAKVGSRNPLYPRRSGGVSGAAKRKFVKPA